jgi:hypothetical protein
MTSGRPLAHPYFSAVPDFLRRSAIVLASFFAWRMRIGITTVTATRPITPAAFADAEADAPGAALGLDIVVGGPVDGLGAE